MKWLAVMLLAAAPVEAAVSSVPAGRLVDVGAGTC